MKGTWASAQGSQYHGCCGRSSAGGLLFFLEAAAPGPTIASLCDPAPSTNLQFISQSIQWE